MKPRSYKVKIHYNSTGELGITQLYLQRIRVASREVTRMTEPEKGLQMNFDLEIKTTESA